MKNEKKFIYILFLLIILIILIILFFIFSSKSIKNVYLGYGDMFSDITLYSSDNVISEICHDDINLVFYLSDECGPCMDKLMLFSQINILREEFAIKVSLVWQDNIPTKQLRKHGLEDAANFTLKNKIKLTGGTPYYFIVEEGKINFATDDVDFCG